MSRVGHRCDTRGDLPEPSFGDAPPPPGAPPGDDPRSGLSSPCLRAAVASLVSPECAPSTARLRTVIGRALCRDCARPAAPQRGSRDATAWGQPCGSLGGFVLRPVGRFGGLIPPSPTRRLLARPHILWFIGCPPQGVGDGGAPGGPRGIVVSHFGRALTTLGLATTTTARRTGTGRSPSPRFRRQRAPSSRRRPQSSAARAARATARSRSLCSDSTRPSRSSCRRPARARAPTPSTDSDSPSRARSLAPETSPP